MPTVPSLRVPVRLAVLAQAAAALCLATTALADEADPELYALTHPGNTVVLGIGSVSRFSAKAEEYSGRTRRGTLLEGGFSLHGGAAFDSPDAEAMRWRIGADGLGLRSSSLDAELGVQGRWRLQLGLDELRHAISDSFQTPYQGVGSARLTLPAGWRAPVVPRVNATAPNARGLLPEVTASSVIVGGALTPPTAAQAAAAAAVQAADLPAFRGVDLFTQRRSSRLATDVEWRDGWSGHASFTNEHREGLRASGAQSRATNGDTASILPVPVDDDDRRGELSIGYRGTSLQAHASVEASSYVNHVRAFSWDLWAAPALNATAATAPSNHWTRLALSGNWLAAPGLRLQFAAHRGRAAQNEALLADATAPFVPVGSAHALVVTDHASLKLLFDASRAWRLSTAYKYDLRDNRTPVNRFGYYDNDNAPTGTSPFAALFPGLSGLGQNFNINANTPYSRRSHQLDATAEGRLSSTQRLKFGAEARQTERWCQGSWINCANARHEREAALRGEWLAQASPELEARVALSAARRRVDYDENAFLALVPMAAVTPSTATGALAGSSAYATLVALGLNGYGPLSGLRPAATTGSALAFYFPLNNALDNLLYGNENRISELAGMRRFNQADRERQTLRSGITWHPGEAWTWQAGLDASVDRYPRSVYGLQRQSSLALNLDAGWSPSESISVNVFASLEQQRAGQAGNTYTANSAATSVNGATAIGGGCFATIALRNASNKLDPCLDWTSTQRDRTATLGAAFTLPKLSDGRLALNGSLSVSRARTDIGVSGGNYVNNPFAGVASHPTGQIAAFYVPASDLPTVRLDSLRLALNGTWQINRKAALRLGYGYQLLRTNDWAYEGLQDGGLTQVLPSREQPLHYRVHSLGLAYVGSY